MALILLVVRLSQLEINYERVNPERLDKPDEIEEEYRSAQAVYVTGSVIFANTEQIAALYDMVQGAPAVLFSMRGLPIWTFPVRKPFYSWWSAYRKNRSLSVCAAYHKV